MFVIKDRASKNEDCINGINVSIKKLNKYLCKTECLFLNRLCFWSSHRKSYGIEKEGRVWIYNTLEQWSEQLNVSKSSARRVIKSLKDKKIIISDYLSTNKRNRTLYYAVNLDGIKEYLSQLNIVPCAHIRDLRLQKKPIAKTSPEHMDEHMYIVDNSKQNINKSYKSIKNNLKKNSEQTVHENHYFDSEDKNFSNSEKPDIETKDTENTTVIGNERESSFQKPTIIQDMIKIWNEEFLGSKIELTKNLARFLVAAFKTKFKSCLKEWRKYLKTLKTSVYIMSEKFKLSIWWVIKFITIDRIRAGELGVDSGKVPLEQEELSERLNQQVKSYVEPLKETESCKKLRYSIIEKLSLSTYLSWFTNVNFIEKNHEKIVMKADSQFVEDWIMQNFADQCGLCVE